MAKPSLDPLDSGDDGRCGPPARWAPSDPLGALTQHHRAPRLLHRALRCRRRAGHAGGAHPRAPRLDARRRRRDRRRGTPRRGSLDPQRPLPRGHPPPRHHRDLADLRARRAARLRREPCPPCRHRRPHPGRHAGVLGDARRGGRRHSAHRRRRGAGPASQMRNPEQRLRRSARPARSQPAPSRGPAACRAAGIELLRAATAEIPDCASGDPRGADQMPDGRAQPRMLEGIRRRHPAAPRSAAMPWSSTSTAAPSRSRATSTARCR